MAGREVREYTNLTDPKDKKWGKGKDKIDDEDITFQRMVAKMQEVAGERGGYLHGRGGTRNTQVYMFYFLLIFFNPSPCDSALLLYIVNNAALDSDDLLYLKEQMEAEEDAERLLRRTEKRAFAAFKKAASLADSTPASVPLPLRVEPKPKSGIRQQDLLKNIFEIKPKRQRVSSTEVPVSNTKALPNGNQRASVSPVQISNSDDQSVAVSSARTSVNKDSEHGAVLEVASNVKPTEISAAIVGSVLGLTYGSSDEDD